jgi:hypothetical protein
MFLNINSFNHSIEYQNSEKQRIIHHHCHKSLHPIMKVILTGVTGFIGHETLLQSIANPRITSIVALSRRELPDSVPKDSKLKVFILEDFTKYTPEIMEELAGAEACVWYAVLFLIIHDR